MSRRNKILLLAAFLLSLCACNSAAPPPVAEPASRSVTPPGFKLPEGSGCSGAIARYRAIQDNDLAMGHVNQNVYDQIRKEIGEAEGACAAGEDAKAQALVRASKARHGYPG
jgi:hypothetical protein